MKKNLSEIISAFEHTAVTSDGKTVLAAPASNPEITSLVFDSRAVKAGSLFFALPGTHTTGNVFIASAIKNGAAAIVFQDDLDEKTAAAITDALAERATTGTTSAPASTNPAQDTTSCASSTSPIASTSSLPFIRVTDSRFVMAPASDAFFDHPSQHLVVIGVTGTEGKSSTVSFIWQLLRQCGKKAGFISTVQYSLGGDAIANPEHQTTPEAPIIQERLSQMLAEGCEYAVVESSSHGLSPRTNRTGCLAFDVGVFMNVTLEHLEFHKTFEQYRDDKANLFRKLDESNHVKTIGGRTVTVPSFGIVNLEDPSARHFISATKQPVLGFTTEGKAGKSAGESATEAAALPPIPDGIPYLLARNIASARYGLSFSLLEPNVVDKYSKPVSTPVIHVTSSLPGAFNAYNLMAAMIAVSRLTETPLEELAKKVPSLTPVKGRMTVIDQGQPFELIVDYAHTPSSFETIFPPIRRRCTGRMICVFGSGGERDTEKRPLQGAVAARFCDTVILADEDPRGEDPVTLLKDIAAGAIKEGKKEGTDLFIIPDRPTAIRRALSLARKDDIVLLLGKSHENSIIYKDRVMPYDEIAEAKTALCDMGYK